jgi:ribosomal protein S12 methylthiotransferase
LKISIVSLGCPKNLVDSERLLARLGVGGMIISPIPEESDVVIINTCGFIAPAVEETKQTIHEMLESSHNGQRIYVMGCAVNRYGNELRAAFPAVSGWFRLEDENNIPSVIGAAQSDVDARLLTTNGYAYLKISEGCSNNCAYCTIPSIKGPYRSFDFDTLVREGRELARSGVKEIILIGQDTTCYGRDLYGKPMLVPLIRKLTEMPGIEWLRLMYAHPKSIDERIIEEISRNNKVCKYIDLPIQHINDRILRMMNRDTDRQMIMHILKQLKNIENMVVRTTVIAGFPTESAGEFNELMHFAERGYIDWLGVFPYYRESGTAAASFEPLPEEIVEERLEKAIAIQQQLMQRNNAKWLHQQYPVLIHGRNKNYIGHTEFAAPEIDRQVVIKQEDLEVGNIYEVTITGIDGLDLTGSVIPQRVGVD